MKDMSWIRKGILALGLLCAPIFGYEFITEQDKTPVKWNKEEVVYLFDENLPQEYKESFVEAANRWSRAIDNKVRFVELEPGKAGRADIYLAKAPLDDKTNAHVEWHSDSNGSMLCAFVRFNDKKEFSRSTDYDTPGVLNLDDIMTHEGGHMAGLKHSDSSKVTYPIREFFDMPTMIATACHQRKGTMKTLHLDDVAGVRALYGLSAPSSETIPLKIDFVSGKRRKDISQIKRLRPGRYEISALAGEGDVMIELDGGDVIGVNKALPLRIKRGYHSVKVQENGNVGTYSFLIGREPRKVQSRESAAQDGVGLEF